MKLLHGQQQGPLRHMASRPAVARPAMRLRVAPKAVDRPSIPALDISPSIPPPWVVEPSSSQSNGREYDGLLVVEWAMTEAERAEIMGYLRSKLSNVMLSEDPRPGAVLERFTTRIYQEGACNQVFLLAFCYPAAEILETYFGGKINCAQKLEGSRADGAPDFVFQILRMQQHRGKATKTWTDLVVGEGKTPTVMRNIPRVVGQVLEQAAAASCKQACDYVRLRGMRYGFLTYLDGTFFIKRLGKDVYAFTDALPPRAQNPTVTEMLLYIGLKQHEQGWWETPECAESAAQIIQQAAPLVVRGTQASSSTSTSIRTNIRAISHPEEALEFTGEILGGGQTGNVVHARYFGQTAAVKSLDLSKQDDLVPLLQNEDLIYEHLQDLQGVCIPRRLGYGLWHNDTTLFIATSVIDGDHPNYESNPPQVLMAIEQALSSIHNHGVLHGDLRTENILLVADGAGGVKAFFLDFGNSIRCDDPIEHAREMTQLRRLLGAIIPYTNV